MKEAEGRRRKRATDRGGRAKLVLQRRTARTTVWLRGSDACAQRAARARKFLPGRVEAGDPVETRFDLVPRSSPAGRRSAGGRTTDGRDGEVGRYTGRWLKTR